MINEAEERGFIGIGRFRVRMPFGQGVISQQDLEVILNFILNYSNEQDVIVKRMLRKEMKEMFLSSNERTQKMIANQVYVPLSFGIGASFLLTAAIFGILGSPALALLFLLGSAFGFLSYRRIKRQ